MGACCRWDGHGAGSAGGQCGLRISDGEKKSRSGTISV